MRQTFTTPIRAAACVSALLALSACRYEAEIAAPTAPQDVFWQSLSSHCGKAYAGTLVSEDAADADFADAAMVMHVSECSEDRIAVPFHVELANEEGELEWDRSRTWIITRQAVPHMSGEGETLFGLRLKHDHRHKDGSEDELTQYGGDTADEGTERVQSFPVDQFSIDMFERLGYEASVTKVWSVEVDMAGAEGGVFAYQLKRTVEGGAPEDRLFRVEFDLGEEVETPPPGWGWE